MKPILIIIFFLVLIWSGIHPKDQFTWFLEVAPSLFGIIILFYTRKSFPFTNLIYILITIHSVILMIGGHYTYAEVPLFDWIKEVLNQSRNNYDKVGHFAQGFVPAMIAREILIRKNIINKKSWLNFIIISICLSISACYEFLEWGVSISTGESAAAFLGTQGDVWDTQSDMLMALIGAIIALIFLTRIHDRQLNSLK